MHRSAVEEPDRIFYNLFKRIRLIYMFRPVKYIIHIL